MKRNMGASHGSVQAVLWVLELLEIPRLISATISWERDLVSDRDMLAKAHIEAV